MSEIKIKSGALGDRAEMPKLEDDELGYRKDTKELYIGASNGNVRLCGADDVSALTNEINNLKSAIDEILARLEETSE
jgi:hypothetical protein